MNTRAIVTSIVSGLILGFTYLALGGTEPSPFQPQINQLNSVTNNLAEIQMMIEGFEPTPFTPIVNQLNAVSLHLGVLYDRVDAALVDVPNDDDVATALEEVKNGAQGVVDRADELYGVLPEQCDEALDNVETGAQNIINRVNEYFTTGT